MAKQNTSQMVGTYTTDFNTQFTNLPVRWSSQAPVPTGFYTPRTNACAGGRLPFEPRHLIAQFDTGTYKYVVPATASIDTLKDALIAAGAICVDLVGEQWSNVPTTQMNTPAPTFRSTPYAAADISGEGDKETGKFDYVSEVLGAQRLGYAIESTNADLLTAQKSGMTNAVEGGLNSRPRNGVITPRHLKIIALVDDESTVNRIVNVSNIGDVANVINSIAPASYFVSYQGESARRLQDI